MKKCAVTGKSYLKGNKVSHANNKTHRRFEVNLQKKRFWVESLNRWIKLRVSAQAMRVIDKKGIEEVLKEQEGR